METRLLKTQDDISFLVDEFYKKIRLNDLLGPIFNSQIKDWPAHLKHISNFWYFSLFHAGSYSGNPIVKHTEVDLKTNHQITQTHFGIWLQLWFETIDQYFHGETAQLAKNRARNMSTFIFLKIFEARKATES